MAFGYLGSTTNVSNLISTAGVGTARFYISGCTYDTDKGIFAFGVTTNIKNLVSNSGVVASDATGVGTARHYAGSTSFA